MTTSAFLFLLTGVLLNAAAQLLLKGGTNRMGVITLTADGWAATLMQMATQGYFIAGIAFYAVSVLVWILGLSRVPVSIAYPLLTLGYVVNAIMDAAYRSSKARAWTPVELEWRGGSTPRIASTPESYDGQVVIKREVLPDGRLKLILKDPASGDFTDRVVAGS